MFSTLRSTSLKPIKDWDDLPYFLRTEAVRPYYDNLKKHEKELYLKRAFDIIAASLLLVILAPIMLVVAIWIKLDSPGPVFFRQTRITQYGKEFRIFKFRTMVNNADKMGSAVTVGNDSRITTVGSIIRKFRIDEFPQLFNVLMGDMSFVGTRPEVPKYVSAYSEEMFSTLLLPAGITSKTSIEYKDEDSLLANSEDVDGIYINNILPEKMYWNLKGISEFNALSEIVIMIKTAFAVLK